MSPSCGEGGYVTGLAYVPLLPEDVDDLKTRTEALATIDNAFGKN